MSLDIPALRELLAAINQTDIAELILKSTDFELTVRRGVRLDHQLDVSEGDRLQRAETSASLPAAGKIGTEAADRYALESTAPPIQTQPTASEVLRDSKADRRLVEINSPMVGTFYRSAAPDEPPFVEVGDRIRKGQTVCIIEAMKLMNELEAEVGGEIVEILVQNGEPIEYGQLLLRLNPA
ncbi:acetyl-CoA carboxylase biotin carboxyl carrier protein [Stenomitos frigidus]|uniref:Biotin carboxyl carrier protein of acetyl-CoA carboxylase n=1 Tax=Stenomitos frigidus ULC18 TaxID=2107698 RepID=A0A2T1ES81_9CYAN|nr:acetyl-CoA carboxylase biotin carboxyl carrier protein [Stenomitos frigidus]PSB35553.1 acetyl-CoA carboxylase, biotin carboxyl carrier protein [Stenomitos frigidus ULC18]